jgi:hypothetical protein
MRAGRGLGLSAGALWCFERTAGSSELPAPAHVVDVLWPADPETLLIGHHELVLRITNPGPAPLVVLGAHEFCGPKLCFKSKHTGPAVANAGETISYIVDLHIREQGPLEARLAVYLSFAGEVTKNCHVIHTVGVSGTSD